MAIWSLTETGLQLRSLAVGRGSGRRQGSPRHPFSIARAGSYFSPLAISFVIVKCLSCLWHKDIGIMCFLWNWPPRHTHLLSSLAIGGLPAWGFPCLHLLTGRLPFNSVHREQPPEKDSGIIKFLLLLVISLCSATIRAESPRISFLFFQGSPGAPAIPGGRIMTFSTTSFPLLQGKPSLPNCWHCFILCHTE